MVGEVTARVMMCSSPGFCLRKVGGVGMLVTGAARFTVGEEEEPFLERRGAALWTVRRTTAPHNDGADFRSAIALYPGCRRLRETAWSARVPTLILIGSVDDWTLASTCQQMVAGARGRSAHVQLVIYPDAHHEFDRANTPIRLRTGLVNTADPSGKAHGGTDPAARTDVFKRVPQWLAR